MCVIIANTTKINDMIHTNKQIVDTQENLVVVHHKLYKEYHMHSITNVMKISNQQLSITSKFTFISH